MKEEKGSIAPSILPVPRSKEDAKRFYDRISRVYDYLTGAFERKYAEMALGRLSVEEGKPCLRSVSGPGTV